MTYTCVCVHFYLFFAFVLNVQFYTYLLSHEEHRTESWTLEQYPRHWKLFKKSCPLSCFTEIYSPFEKSIVLSFLDVHFYTKFQRSRSIFGRCNDRLVVQSLIVSPPPPGSHSDNFSPISVIFSGKGNKKREEEEWNTRSIPKWQIRKDPFPQNLIDSSFVKLLQNSRDSTIFE